MKEFIEEWLVLPTRTKIDRRTAPSCIKPLVLLKIIYRPVVIEILNKSLIAGL